jgi:small subunit ribosomal protein S21
MIIIERKDRENIDQMVKRYKRKHRKIKFRNELRRRKEFTKPSIKRRTELLKAKYRLQEYGKE